MKNFLILILKGIKYRTTRSWLTILGIVIGIMMVVVILSLGNGIKSVIGNALQVFGSDLIMVFPGKETNPIIGFLGGQKFKERDLMELENIEGVSFVLPMEISTVNTEFKGEKKAIMIHASPWEGIRKIYEESQGVRLEEGRWPQNDKQKEVVLGYKIANDLFKRKVRIGEEFIIKSKKMKVVGIVSELGEQMSDNVVYISLDTLRDFTGARDRAGSAFIKIGKENNIDLVAKKIRHQLSKQEVVSDFSVLTPEKAGKLIDDILSIVELVLVFIALISLLVGAVGIMNTMYTSVLERTKQIGIMKAIGASNDSVMTLFLIESGIIGLVGGALGIIVGIIFAYLLGEVAASFGIKGLFSFTSLDYLGLLVVLIITFLIGVISGILPARQASKMEPAEALRR